MPFGWNMSTEQAYLQAVRDFVQALGADASGFDEGAEVSFEHDGLFAFIFLHPLEDKAVIDVEIFKLQDASPDPAQRERLLLLHQLNSITRFTHGATAFVSVDNTLMLSREVAVEGLSGEGLKHTLAQVLDAATDLRAAWTHLRELIVRAGRVAQGQTEAEGLLSSHPLV